MYRIQLTSFSLNTVAEAAMAPELAQLWRILKLYLRKKLDDRSRESVAGMVGMKPQQSVPSGLSTFNGASTQEQTSWQEVNSGRSSTHDTSVPKKSASVQTKSSTSSGEGDLEGERDEVDAALLFSQSPVENNSSLWQRGSVNLLMKLNKIQPLKGEEFLLSSEVMIQDNLELKNAFRRAQRSPWRQQEDLAASTARRRQIHSYENPLRKESRYLRDLALRRQRETVAPNSAKLTRQSRLKRSSSEGSLGVSIGTEEEGEKRGQRWEDSAGEPPAKLESYLKTVYPRLIEDILEHHAEQGDVQTCVMVALVLEKYIEVDAGRLRQWLCSYVDVLQRMQLFPVAARIISTCNNEYVRARYQRSNVVAMECTTAGCNEKLVMTKGFKGKCQTCSTTISECSICQLPVRVSRRSSLKSQGKIESCVLIGKYRMFLFGAKCVDMEGIWRIWSTGLKRRISVRQDVDTHVTYFHVQLKVNRSK